MTPRSQNLERKKLIKNMSLSVLKRNKYKIKKLQLSAVKKNRYTIN